MKAFLASPGYCGRRTPAELLARLRAAPTGLADEAEAEAKGEMVRALAAVLEPLVGEIARLTGRIEQAVADSPDGQIVMSFPRAGRICAAAILAELGNVRERFPAADQLAADRPQSGHPCLGQEPRRRLPLGLQSPSARGDHLLRRQLPTRLPMGRRRLQSRQRPSPRHPHPRPGLDTRAQARLDGPCPLRPGLA
jgi:hypothetical protein